MFGTRIMARFGSLGRSVLGFCSFLWLFSALSTSAHAQAKQPCQMTETEAHVFRLANGERARQNLAPFGCHALLVRAARFWNQKMCKDRFFSHDDPSGVHHFSNRMSSLSQDLAQLGLRQSRSAENIFAGSPSPKDAMRSWMRSAGHRANLLNPQLNHLGVGYAFCKGRHLWTQIFMTLGKAPRGITSFGTQLAPEKPLEGSDTASLLLLPPGTRQRSVSQQKRSYTQEGIRYLETTTTTTTTTVLQGPRPASRRLRIKTEVVIVTQSPQGTKRQRRVSTQERVITDL